jgi:hypothetical protein
MMRQSSLAIVNPKACAAGDDRPHQTPIASGNTTTITVPTPTLLST